MGHMVERAQIIIKGTVQGVGFRPFVYKLARSLDLKGYVTNTGEGVIIDVEGSQVATFIRRLRAEAPPLSRINELTTVPLPLKGYSDFTILQSTDPVSGRPFTLVSPDVSFCDDCLRELLDPSDRRYLYPFINCTNCGPRYSITRSVPYDRPNTTMAGFTMCQECHREYQDPVNRRFHAQPNACATCGPQVAFRVGSSECGMRSAKCGVPDTPSPQPSPPRGEGEIKHPLPVGERTKVRGEAIQPCIQLLLQGGIVAIKGIGGFHLACDAANDGAVERLRERKRKSNKPFAVMAPDLESIVKFCVVSEKERTMLLSNQRPIVLLRKKGHDPLAAAVSPSNTSIGCMLPYTPLHQLLFSHPLRPGAVPTVPHFTALVMTSGNLSEEPIVRDNDEAMQKLSGIADGFLLHDRDIFMRVDDSVVKMRSTECGGGNGKNSEIKTPHSELLFLRRSRGFAPEPIMLHEDGPEVLGCGADLKNTFALTKGKFAIVSQHIGDMENYETLRFFEECLENLKAVYRVEPVAIVHDLHPGYLSTRWAEERGAWSRGHGAEGSEKSEGDRDQGTGNFELKRFTIQHHYAHIGSVMAEHGLTRKVIGVAFDGSGYGTDGNLWGGEFLIAGIDGFDRAGQFKYVSLPGGDAAIKEPWKTSVSYVMDAVGDKIWGDLERIGFINKYGSETIGKVMVIARSQEFSPFASGAGRLFDAVAAILGVCDQNTFEGEAAIALESIVQEGTHDEYRVEFNSDNGYTVISFSPLIREIIADLEGKISREMISTKFHNTIVSVVRTMVKVLSEQYGLRDVALSGGTFQNSYILNRLISVLSHDGMTVYANQKVPCNDACISLGQAYVVRERLKKLGFYNPLPIGERVG